MTLATCQLQEPVKLLQNHSVSEMSVVLHGFNVPELQSKTLRGSYDDN